MPRYRIVDLITGVIILGSMLLDIMLDIPVLWYVGVVGVYLLITTLGATLLSLEYFLPVRSRGVRTDAIAITFDDGPVPGKTERILAILHSRGIPATFFCIGHRVAENPALVQAVHDGGH